MRSVTGPYREQWTKVWGELAGPEPRTVGSSAVDGCRKDGSFTALCPKFSVI